jgi:hypothetical protein
VSWLGNNRSYECNLSCRSVAHVWLINADPRRLALAAGTRPVKKIHTCAPCLERDFQRGRDAEAAARAHERAGILFPRSLVEVHRDKPAGVVLQEWIHPGDDGAGEMLRHDLVIDGQKGLVWTVTALHPRLLADPRFPLVGAGWDVAALALAILPTKRIDVLPAAKEVSEQCDLRRGRRVLVHGRCRIRTFAKRPLCLRHL